MLVYRLVHAPVTRESGVRLPDRERFSFLFRLLSAPLTGCSDHQLFFLVFSPIQKDFMRQTGRETSYVYLSITLLRFAYMLNSSVPG